MRAITICVEYSDFLSHTLPRNRHHFDEYMIVTASHDKETVKVAEQYDCRILVTDAFYDNGASFNKYLPMEYGFDAMGRHGWLCILDADIVLPRKIEHQQYEKGFLYNPRRRFMEDVTGDIQKKIELPWDSYPLDNWLCESPGYLQLFHAEDSHLPAPPWHQTNWKHAGGGDSFFQLLWPDECKVRIPWDVLHLGPKDHNWCGRVTPFLNGQLPKESRKRRHALRDMMRERWKKPGGVHDEHRYDHERIWPEQ